MRLTLAVAIAATVSSAAAFTVHAFAHDKCEDTAANDQKYLAAGAAVSPVSGLGLVDGLALGVQSYCVDVSKVGVAEALSVAVGLRKDDETEDSIRTLRVFSDQGCQTALIALKTTATPATTATTAACAAPNSIAAGAGVCACVGLNTAARGRCVFSSRCV